MTDVSHRRVLGLVLPLMVASVATPLLVLLDTALVGRLPESSSLGAVAVGTTIFNYVYWAFSFLRMSTTALVAQARGAGNTGEVRAALARSALVAGAIGFMLILLEGPLVHLAFSWMDGSPEVEASARAYVAIRIWSAPAAFGNYVLLGLMMGMQRPGMSMVMEVLRGVTQAGLALILVLGLDRGVDGVATAAVAAEWIALAAGTVVALRLLRTLPSATGTGTRVLEGRAFVRLFALNGDLFVRTQCLLIVFLLFTAGGAALGDDTLAANAVLLNLYLLVSYALGAFAQVASTLVGHAVGAREPRALLDAIRVTSQWAVAIAMLSSVVLALGGDSIVALLTTVEGVRPVAHQYLLYAAALPTLAVLSFQFDGVSIGATRTAVLRNVLLAALAAFLAARWALVPRIGNHGLWIAFCTFMSTRSAGFFLAWRGLARDAKVR